ncbi:MAG: transposase [Ruminococcus sp.]|uniref:Transposase n=1 Tax=Schaedlerella arabinosiphila TaxID=2044587 RepID=A0A3R8R892_9FIRM|nr:transposase [Ruminococcus sp.]RRK34274.1 transposase [Schaedlerella arabinosiphila]
MPLKADTITKDYVKDADVFADIFNYYIYGGRQVILPELLTERDSTKIALPYGADGAAVPVQKFRDVQKLYAAMTDGKMEYVLYGTENQAEIHYAMAVKNNLYDALEYAGQVEEAAKSHRKEMKRKKEQAETSADEDRKAPNTGEFLSGFWAEDRLIPSITVTIFFSSEEWDGPLSLFDMMDVSDPDVLACMDNYQVRLIAPAHMPDEEIMKFQSSLREVMLFIKYSKDKENLIKVLAANEARFREVERRAADVIEAITNSGIKYDEGEEVVNVCQAIQEMRKESELKKAQEVAENLYKMGLDIEKIAQAVDYAAETVRGWLGLSDDAQ